MQAKAAVQPRSVDELPFGVDLGAEAVQLGAGDRGCRAGARLAAFLHQRHCRDRVRYPNRSGSSRAILSNSGWKLNQPATLDPTCDAVLPALASSMSTGVPAASASSCAWHERSMVMNHQAASSTDWPTVSRPWLRRMTALEPPRPWARR